MLRVTLELLAAVFFVSIATVVFSAEVFSAVGFGTVGFILCGGEVFVFTGPERSVLGCSYVVLLFVITDGSFLS
ncbi:hypothetical protein BX661DRAFT_180437 [Kickxella alabastrina]|uniref:uncharacterized protein n=1 Tax=Kickxella alabastrina TaxID=61397 RepID=UPI00221FF953|nr:uncharacterized protein BX661DRAFT_180437 [Kickxella alabastrina]KAI7830995.1 hypothetical protein BX661DRAFT_180437 [Kickxella alabastrina]